MQQEIHKPTLQRTTLDKIRFVSALYVRSEHDPQLVQKYAADIESIEACQAYLSVDANGRLIDGRHRQLAYATAYPDQPQREISVWMYPFSEDDDALYDQSCRLNSAATRQMTESDKRKAAIKKYMRANRQPQEEIAHDLKVDIHKVSSWLKSVLQAEKEEREATIWDMWLSCHTQQEIADATGQARSSVAEILQILSKSCGQQDSDIFRNFEPKIYNIWNFKKLTNASRVFGSVPQEVVDNLLYYYTKPFDIVFDPFGGGGATIDVCKKRLRRYYVSDLSPIPARPDIREWDIVDELPPDLPVPDLVYLDPPYWKQAQEKYSQKTTDLGNVDLEMFLSIIANITKAVKRKWGNARPNARLALIIGMCKEDGKYFDLPLACYEVISKYLPLVFRYQVPYSTEIHGGHYVKMAKENKEPLYLFRDLMVFGKDTK